MKFVYAGVAVLAAVGTAAYFYLQDKDGKAAEDQANAQRAEATAEAEESAANI
jgi:uncharacterized protein (UPF0333 family)